MTDRTLYLLRLKIGYESNDADRNQDDGNEEYS
jgi:hypothetical protein